MFGRSPRTYASNVRFSTVAQSRSRLSFSTTSSACSGIAWPDSAAAAARAMRSPLMKRSPRSGQLRDGSNGLHLSKTGDCQRGSVAGARDHLPEIVEVIREGALVEAVKAECAWGGTSITRSIEQVAEPVARALDLLQHIAQ